MLQSAAAFTSPALPMNPHTVCPKVCDALRVLHGSGHSVVSRARPTGCDSHHCLLSGSAVFVPVHGDAGCSACQAPTSRCKAERGGSERKAVGDRQVNESAQRARQRPRVLVSAWARCGQGSPRYDGASAPPVSLHAPASMASGHSQQRLWTHKCVDLTPHGFPPWRRDP